MDRNRASPQDHFSDSNGMPIRYITKGSRQAVVRLHGLTGNVDHLVESSSAKSPFDEFHFIAPAHVLDDQADHQRGADDAL